MEWMLPLIWLAIAAYRLRNWFDDKRTVEGLLLRETDFIFPYEIVWAGSPGRDFSYRYLGAIIHVKAFEVGKRGILAIQIDKSFPTNVFVRKNYQLIASVMPRFPLRSWSLKSVRSQLGLIVSSKDVMRQLSLIPEYELVAITREKLVAARYFDGVCDQDIILRGASALYNLHIYARKALEAGGVHVESMAGELDCPFCKSIVNPGEDRACSDCGTLHHSSCWMENGGCAVFGCQKTG